MKFWASSRGPSLPVPDSATSPASQRSESLSLAPDLVLRVGFAGKRQLDRAQTETVRTRLCDVFSVIGWRLVGISPLDDATNERPVPVIAKFYSHKRPTLRLMHRRCAGADSIASGVEKSSIQKSKINNPQSSISPGLPHIRSFQPPAAAPARYASWVVRQSAVDRLFDAIIRTFSPPSLPDLRQEKLQFENFSHPVFILPLQPLDLLTAVRYSWLKQQAIYHDRNARNMDYIDIWAENWRKISNFTVIGCSTNLLFPFNNTKSSINPYLLLARHFFVLPKNHHK